MKYFLIIILLTFCFSSCSLYGDRYKIDTTLEAQDYLKGATTRALAIKDFSVVNGYEYLWGDSIPLTRAYCTMFADTIEISIGYSSEGVQHPVFKLVDRNFTSETVIFSDIPEYNGNHIMRIPTSHHSLTLNKEIYSIGDTIIGNFSLVSDTIRYNNWNQSIVFNGNFQSIVEERK